MVMEHKQAGDLGVEYKDWGEPVTKVDHLASDLLVSGLRQLYPDDVIISEENPLDDRRLTADRCWYVDPIDGTKDFIAGGDGFCVMVGLWAHGAPIFGAVVHPPTDTVYWGIVGEGAWKQCKQEPVTPLKVSSITKMADARLVASKSHRPPTIDNVKSSLGIGTERNIGSVGLKLALIADNEYDLYVNPLPRCKVWDTCAPEAILIGAGGKFTDLYGRPLAYRDETITRPDGLLASNGHLHDIAVQKMKTLFQKP